MLTNFVTGKQRNVFNVLNTFRNYKSCTRNSPNISIDNDVIKNSQLYRNMAPNYLKYLDNNTLFLHRTWRNAIIDNIEINENSKILDVAGGTGLNAFRLLKKYNNANLQSNLLLTVLDINPYMLDIGINQCKNLGFNQDMVKFVEGDVHSLPFEDGSFDTVIFSLAIKSTVNFSTVFREINRILKPQGKFIVLDFYFKQNYTLIQRLYIKYLKYVASIIEKAFIGNLKTSEYVATEISEVVSQTNIKSLMKEANFQNLEIKPLSFGIAALTIGFKR